MKEEEPKNAEAIIKDIRRRTKRKFSSEEKIRIVISGLRGDESINVICRKEGIAPALYYRWSKDFMEAGKRRLSGDTLCSIIMLERSRYFRDFFQRAGYICHG